MVETDEKLGEEEKEEVDKELGERTKGGGI
jgi:hypothetical protein